MADRLSLVRRQPARVIDWWSPTGGSAALLAAHYPRARLLPFGCDHQPLPERAATEGGTRWWQRLVGPSTRSADPRQSTNGRAAVGQHDAALGR